MAGQRMRELILEEQAKIVAAIEKIDGTKFTIDRWTKDNNEGGGITACIERGNVIERGAANVSMISGRLPERATHAMRANHEGLRLSNTQELDFNVWGLSMIIHPHNPMAPTVHLNYRYFEALDLQGNVQAWWFGGGTDLTPCYLFEEDAIEFHQSLKACCDAWRPGAYAEYKDWCDRYFYNAHRGEARGIGGIFFDDLSGKSVDDIFPFVSSCLKAFLPVYTVILERRINLPYTEEQKYWQQLRRGRYVEFNLVHDRGTAFGLQTPGARIESILCSMPATAAWAYQHSPAPGSEEERLVDVLVHPVDWIKRAEEKALAADATGAATA